MKTFIYITCFLMTFTVLPANAAIDNLSQALNESGRLRMLSQRLAKAYLLKAMDIQPDVVNKQLLDSAQKFEQNLIDLKEFSASINHSDTLRVAIDVIDLQWQAYYKVLSQTQNSAPPDTILTLSDRTLLACESLVVQLEKITQRQSAQWVNLSGRQRMLSQRIAKLYSAISLSGHKDLYDDSLQQSVHEFDIALQALIKSPDNTHFVKHKLKKVATQWNFSKQGFKSLKKGNSTPLVIFMTTESILNQMNDITALYEEIDNQKKRMATI